MMSKTLIAGAIAGAVACFIATQSEAQAACQPSQINGRWALYGGHLVWFECRFAVRGNRNLSGQCRLGGDPLESEDWEPVSGILTVSRACAVRGQFDGGVVIGTMQGNGQSIAGLLIETGPGQLIDRPGFAISAVRRP
jgi:hypothetical protein